MFSVPGWNVSAPLATQIEKPKPRDPSKEGKKAQKRKRKQEEQIDAGNVGKYWDKVVGGEDHVGDGTQEKRGKKRKRKNKAAKESQDGIDGVDATKQGTEAKDEVPVAEPAAPEAPTPAQKDAESKRSKKKRKKDHKPDIQPISAPPKATEAPKPLETNSLLPEPKGLTPLQKSMRQKLASARFRHLNEALYTKPSAESLSFFKDDPSMFEDYHRGFAQQVEVWPENPVDGYVNTILARGKVRTKDPWKDAKRKEKRGKSTPGEEVNSTPIKGAIKPLPRNIKGHSTIADLGCGTASLSYRLQPYLKSLNLTLHSFDLSKPSGPSAPLVTVADISALPLPDNSVDIAIFCLALMGTNWLDFIDEAHRVLRWRGELWIAEIKSRFGRVERRKAGQGPINSVGSLKKADKKGAGKGKKKGGGGGGGDAALKEHEEGIQDSSDEAELATRIDGVEAQNGGTDVSAFVSILLKHGFVLDALPERQSDAVDLTNKMFVKLHFVKGAQPTVGKNAKKDGAGAARAGAGEGYSGRAAAGFNASRGGLKMGIKGKKFTAIANEDDSGNDGKVLKPCLYKIR
ncbi:hypothetical protein K458DRAFT_302869 [Lentithecium fluviatile CBS 122367]|uniref:Ribosomal RNA-processing protein 8 n=1 Tax=Lentithecium fluviatile CBS 122367 TaxID=1168545 RepID=A0A6G1J271_9PLEO|nr:hypothetical protein K458DRAFT_302869 [Lentithecium fluviatile CBS 122367]